jgi:hypothetical protein
MTEAKTYSPLKIGLLIVAVAYFLFAVHETFTLSWIGEWEYLTGSFSFDIFVEDISGYIGIIFRLIASIIALSTVILYFAKKSLSTSTITKALRWIIVMEAIYWLGLLVTSVISVQDLVLGSFSNLPAIKWGLITGTIYILVFWLSNTTMWASTITQKGTEYLTAYPENLLSFALTTIGLLALTVFTAYFTKKSVGTETVENLKLRTIGAIVLALGLYFLWNYLTWIFFGGDYLWSDWYAWFLGHNLDLWMLSLPLLGLPLLFKRKNLSKANTPTPPT